MFDYAICEIAGKQYRVMPGKEFEVPLRPDDKETQAKVLLLVEGDKVKLGNPYLKVQLNLKIVKNVLGRKTRVFKYHAKANYRKLRGYRSKLTKVIYSA